MTQPSNSSNASTVPPPGTFPGPPPSDISQEDRMLAAAAYVSYFLGFWIVAPAAIYVLRREKSRFVAHHAIRAIIVQGLLVPVVALGFLLSFFAALLVASVSAPRAGEPSGAVVALFALSVWGGWLIPFMIHLATTIFMAIAAFQGRIQTRSLLGRLTERILGQDKSVAIQ